MFGFKKKSVVEEVKYVHCNVCDNDVIHGLVFPADNGGSVCWYCVSL
jgi:hypothetical protein